MNVISLPKCNAQSLADHTLVLRTPVLADALKWEALQKLNPTRNVSRSIDILRSPTRRAFIHVVVSANKGALDDQVQPTLSQPPRFALTEEEVAAKEQAARRARSK